MKVHFTYPGQLPGMNDIIAMARSGPHASARQKKSFTEDVAKVIHGFKGLTSPVAVMFDWYEKNGRRDPDNIMAGQKFILDAMVCKGILTDDGPKHIESLSHRFHVDAASPRVEVVAYEVGQEENPKTVAP